MKTHFSFIIGILLGITLSFGLCSVSGANPPQKGAITTGLIRGLGVHIPQKLEEQTRLVNGSIPAKTVHRASVIPALDSGSQVIQTSAEQTVEQSVQQTEDPFVSDLNATTPEAVLTPASSTDSEPKMILDEPEINLTDVQDAQMVPDSVPASDPILTQSPAPAGAGSTEIPAVQAVENLSALDEGNGTQAVAPSELPSNFDTQSGMDVLQPSTDVPATAPIAVNQLKKAETSEPPVNIPASNVMEGAGKPGDVALEGIQLSRLSVQKVAPEEIQVGQPAVWTIAVRNESKITAVGVQIHDVIPAGTQLVSTNPPAQVSPNGEITWNVGNMPSGTMAAVKMELTPTREGEIGSVASVTSHAEASAKSVATRPMLKVETFGDAVILLGNKTELNIVVSNPGTGTAHGIVLSETVPAELQFEGGAELRYEVGDLKPGESKPVKLPLTAVRPGKFQNRLIAKGSANLQTESVLAMEVTAPNIQMEVQGPSKRFLDKEGTFRLIATNSGTATARNIELKALVPNGWQFVRANNLGAYLKENQAVVWKLEELAPGTTAEAELVLVPKETGNFVMSYSAMADSCQTVNGTKNLTVEGIAALMFQVVDSNDPIQVGEETKYTVEVVNQGSKPAEDVQVVIHIPTGLKIVSSEETARSANVQDGAQIAFEPIPSLGPKASKVYRFTLKGIATGDQRVAVKLSSKEFQTPIVKEESTQVFAE